MMLLFMGWCAHLTVVWWAYETLGRLFSVATLAVCSALFLVAATGLAGDEGSAAARTLCWVMLAVWTVPAVVVGLVRDQV